MPTLYIAGARNIGRTINRTPKATFALLESGQLPARKVGGVWTLDVQAFAEQFRSSVAA
jgi:hypothetical protein